ncbi:PAS domain-containing sensor histidine kinase [Halobellus ordinarius]|uniref:PAS domain-containing sensor histidine kinase n=1 Tax=Halobellus ordinarius TaxID=3075120 RepID=UPI00288037A6|nr:ATP-binding protein [Halobellus sp. ZY16]
MTAISASSLLDAFGDLFFVFDGHGRLTEWNQATARATGLTDDELSGASPSELVGEPDAASVESAVETALKTGDAAIEVHLPSDGETPVPYEIELHRLPDNEDQPSRFVGIGREVSEREYYRERASHRQEVLQRIYQIISDSARSFEMQVTDLLELGRAELDVAYGTLSEIHGTEYHFEVVAAPDDSIQSGDVVPLSATNCELAASERETLVAGNVERDAPDQTHRAGFTDWGISCYVGAPVYVDDEVYGTFCFYDTEPRTGQFDEWEVTLVDLMSRWVSYELQHRRSKERLKRQNEKLERFASIVSHDLRNPLNVLTGTIELAAETGDLDHLDSAERAIERMETLIDELLTLSRAGETIDETEPLDLRSLVDRCRENVPLGEATLRIETDRTVSADRSRLAQLIENLLRNAVEHGSTSTRSETHGDADEHGSTSTDSDVDGDTGDRLTITVGDLPDGFYVEDDGRGIPESDRQTVFESGYTTASSGTGFGLEIVAEIAEAHGWDVRVTEGDAGGARFEITGLSELSPGDDEKPEA